MADGMVKGKLKKGSKQLRVHLAGKDKDHLQLFHDALGSANKICTTKTGSIRSSHSSDQMCDDLIQLGCTPKKSLTLRFPKLPKWATGHFIRGYFDGDGCASMTDGRLFLSFIGTAEFLNELQVKLDTRHKLQKRKNVSQLTIGSIQNCKRVIKVMYSKATVFLARKKAVVDEWKYASKYASN